METSTTETRRGLPVYKANPFTDHTLIKTRKRSLTVDRGTAILAAETREETATTTIAQVKEVDDEKFVKLFSASIHAYFDLSAAGLKVFSVLLLAVQNAPNIDRVYINAATASEAAAGLGKLLSTAVYHRGMKELVEKKIIAHSVQQGWVFINPAILFNGDRARFMLELRKKEKQVLPHAGETSLSDLIASDPLAAWLVLLTNPAYHLSMELTDWRETVRRLVATDAAFRAALAEEAKANPDIAGELLQLLTQEPTQLDEQGEEPPACGPQPGQP